MMSKAKFLLLLGIYSKGQEKMWLSISSPEVTSPEKQLFKWMLLDTSMDGLQICYRNHVLKCKTMILMQYGMSTFINDF